MKKYLLFILIVVSSIVFADTNSNVINIKPIGELSQPQVGSYSSTSGQYIGSTATVNGGTTYLQSGKYQGQAPANSNIYINNNSQAEQRANFVNQLPD